MPTAREVKRRIRGVKNIMQVTRALEAVSASKVRRATAAVARTRSYTNNAWEILLNIAGTAAPGMPLHPLLDVRKDKPDSITIILITGDRGLAGAYNSNIIRVARQFGPRMGVHTRWVAVGRKGRDSLIRSRDDVVAEFTGLPTTPTVRDVGPISQLVIDDYLNGKTGEVYLAYTDFVNTLTQRPTIQRLLPLTPVDIQKLGGMDYLKRPPEVTVKKGQVYEYEPDAATILAEIVPKFTVMVIYQAILEASASEQSARMVAMRNATESAGELSDSLVLVYNKARQAGITSEILDIVGGVEALRKQAVH